MSLQIGAMGDRILRVPIARDVADVPFASSETCGRVGSGSAAVGVVLH